MNSAGNMPLCVSLFTCCRVSEGITAVNDQRVVIGIQQGSQFSGRNDRSVRHDSSRMAFLGAYQIRGLSTLVTRRKIYYKYIFNPEGRKDGYRTLQESARRDPHPYR